MSEIVKCHLKLLNKNLQQVNVEGGKQTRPMESRMSVSLLTWAASEMGKTQKRMTAMTNWPMARIRTGFEIDAIRN